VETTKFLIMTIQRNDQKERRGDGVKRNRLTRGAGAVGAQKKVPSYFLKNCERAREGGGKNVRPKREGKEGGGGGEWVGFQSRNGEKRPKVLTHREERERDGGGGKKQGECGKWEGEALHATMGKISELTGSKKARGGGGGGEPGKKRITV